MHECTIGLLSPVFGNVLGESVVVDVDRFFSREHTG